MIITLAVKCYFFFSFSELVFDMSRFPINYSKKS